MRKKQGIEEETEIVDIGFWCVHDKVMGRWGQF